MAATPVLHYWICLQRDQLSMSHHSHDRPPAGHPHPTLLCSLQPVGRSNYFMRLTAPQNSHNHTDRQSHRQTAQLNYIYRYCISYNMQACIQMRVTAFKCKCKCAKRFKCKCKCKCTAFESNANASAQHLNQMQMQMHLNQMQMQMHLNQMQMQMQTI